MKVFYQTLDGRILKSTSLKLSLINWYFDEVDGDNKSMVYIADDSSLFVQQITAAIERRFGRSPRWDERMSEKDQFLYLLKFIYQQGGFTKLMIS